MHGRNENMKMRFINMIQVIRFRSWQNFFLSCMCGIGLLVIASCESFLGVEPPPDKIPSELIFADDAAATGAVVGIYLNFYDRLSFAGGRESSIGVLAGLSADELLNDPGAATQLQSFELNQLIADNANILNIWTSMYKGIYQANAILEGLEKPNGVTPATRDQLKGEALFVRAFCH